MRTRIAAGGIVLLTLSLAMGALCAGRADEPSPDEAAFFENRRWRSSSRVDRRLTLPVQDLRRPGSHRIGFEYWEDGFPLGMAMPDTGKPVALSRERPAEFVGLPAPVRKEQWYGVLELGPATAPSRFALVLDVDPEDWGKGLLLVAKGTFGDFSRETVRLEHHGTGNGNGFATELVAPIAYPDGEKTVVHPMVVWCFTDVSHKRLRFYPLCHRRARVLIPDREKPVDAVVLDFSGNGVYSDERLYLDFDGSGRIGRHEEAAAAGAGGVLRTGKAEFLIEKIGLMGDFLDVVLTPVNR